MVPAGDSGAEGVFQVEVAYARPDEQAIISLEVKEGTTVGEAVARSGIADRFPEVDLDRNKVGIFGRLVDPRTPLRPQDRVEIYRPLTVDPKESRRRRAKKRQGK